MPSERSSNEGETSRSSAERPLCEEQLKDISGKDTAGGGASKNPYDIGTEATVAALRCSGVLTPSGKLGKTFR